MREKFYLVTLGHFGPTICTAPKASRRSRSILSAILSKYFIFNMFLFAKIVINSGIYKKFAFLWYFTLYFNGVLLCVFAVLYFVFLRHLILILLIYRSIFVALIETEMSLSFFITSKIHTYYVKKQESIRVVIPVHEPPYRPFDEERAIPYLAALQGNP